MYIRGKKLGHGIFILTINDLRILESDCWKYIDETTISEIVSKGNTSTMQNSVDLVQHWSITNKLLLHDSKSKELRFCFTRSDHALLHESVVVCGNELEVVTHARILVLTISSDLK